MAGWQALSLPAGVHPIWIEGIITSEYERDTLPLLFSTDAVFNEYYDVLRRGNEHIAQAVEQIRCRNQRARDERAEGYWRECLTTLAQCVHLRRCVFDDDDFQCTAAIKHYILSVLNFASFFLKETRGASAPGPREALLGRAFELFKRAEIATREVPQQSERCFLRACVGNNFANYFWRRCKPKAAAQQAGAAHKHWKRSRVPQYTEYFQAREAGALCFQEQWEAAAKALTACANNAADAAPLHEADHAAPVRFHVQLMASALPVGEAGRLVVLHNLAVSMVGQRRYKEGAAWSRKAAEAVERAGDRLGPSHPWAVAVRSCQVLCEKMSHAAPYLRFKMKPEEIVVADLQQMNRIAADSRTVADFSSLLQLQRQRRAKVAEARMHEELAAKRQTDETLRRKASASPLTYAAAALYMSPSPYPQERMSAAKRRRKPIAALRCYLPSDYATYKQFVGEVKEERKRAKAARAASPPQADRPPELEDRGSSRGSTPQQEGAEPSERSPSPSPASPPAAAEGSAAPPVAESPPSARSPDSQRPGAPADPASWQGQLQRAGDYPLGGGGSPPPPAASPGPAAAASEAEAAAARAAAPEEEAATPAAAAEPAESASPPAAAAQQAASSPQSTAAAEAAAGAGPGAAPAPGTPRDPVLATPSASPRDPDPAPAAAAPAAASPAAGADAAEPAPAPAAAAVSDAASPQQQQQEGGGGTTAAELIASAPAASGEQPKTGLGDSLTFSDVSAALARTPATADALAEQERECKRLAELAAMSDSSSSRSD